MGQKFTITEQERNQIRGLYEQGQPTNVNTDPPYGGFFISGILELYFQFIPYSLYIGGQYSHIRNIYPI